MNVTKSEDKRKRENELIMLRARVNNKVLIKNYNLGDFIDEMDTTIQDVLNYILGVNTNK